jgi:uncharacterized protein (DUF849 family)
MAGSRSCCRPGLIRSRMTCRAAGIVARVDFTWSPSPPHVCATSSAEMRTTVQSERHSGGLPQAWGPGQNRSVAYPPLLQAALNGDRVHPATPHSPEEIAAEAKAAVAAGAQSVHLHPYGDDGRQTLDAGVCAETIRRVRQACPGTTISLTTSADVVEDPAERLRLIAAWTVLPDLVTANQGEEGILEVCELLVSRGVGIEAGLLSIGDARQFVAADVAGRCVRAMVEPLDADPSDAVAHAEAIENTLHEADVALEQVHHGDGIASWAVNRRAISRGHGIRTGLEDTPVLPDGRQAQGNGDLIAAAAAMQRRRLATS